MGSAIVVTYLTSAHPGEWKHARTTPNADGLRTTSQLQPNSTLLEESEEPPNEKRLSCAAVLCCSQKQFYYDGRRQLQPLVRQTRDDTEQSPTEIRQELWPSVRQGIP
jgi:hypothetical protein